MKFLFVIVCSVMLFSFGANASQGAIHRITADSAAFKEYTGNYKFTPDAPVKSLTVFIQNDTLSFSSDEENGTFTRVEGDNFNFTSTNYTGKASFKRDADGKVSGIVVYVNNMTLEATKQKES